MILVLIPLSFFLAKGAIGVLAKRQESAHNLSELEDKSRSLKARGQELNERIIRLKSEDGLIEEIKTKFNVAREGEQLAIILKAEEASTTEPSTLERIKNWFKWESLWPW